MENENSLKSADRNDDGQISFEILNRDILADRIRKTNVDELSDEECREFLKELQGWLINKGRFKWLKSLYSARIFQSLLPPAR